MPVVVPVGMWGCGRFSGQIINICHCVDRKFNKKRWQQWLEFILGKLAVIVRLLDHTFRGKIIKMIFFGKYTANAFGGLIASSDSKAAVETPLSQIGRTLEEMIFTRGE